MIPESVKIMLDATGITLAEEEANGWYRIFVLTMPDGYQHRTQVSHRRVALRGGYGSVLPGEIATLIDTRGVGMRDESGG